MCALFKTLEGARRTQQIEFRQEEKVLEKKVEVLESKASFTQRFRDVNVRKVDELKRVVEHVKEEILLLDQNIEKERVDISRLQQEVVVLETQEKEPATSCSLMQTIQVEEEEEIAEEECSVEETEEEEKTVPVTRVELYDVGVQSELLNDLHCVHAARKHWVNTVDGWKVQTIQHEDRQ